MGTNSNKLVRLTKYIRNTLQPSDNPAGGLPLPTSSRTACRACPGRAPSSPPRAPSGSSLARCLIRSSDVNLSTRVCISQILAEYSQNTLVLCIRRKYSISKITYVHINGQNQGGRTWQPFVGGKNGHEIFR